MPDLRRQLRRVARPIRAGESRGERSIRVRTGEDVVFVRRGRAGPLTVDALPALVEEERGVAVPGVELRQSVGDELPVRVVPRSGADPIAGVRRLVAVG